MPQFSLGLWPMFFCDLVIECMATGEQTQGLCCLPIQIKRKWYPLILIAIFSLLFFQLSMWFGLAVGYMYHFGFFSRIEMGANRAVQMEAKFPFRRYAEQEYFITTGNSMGGEVLPSFMNRAASSSGAASETASASTAASNNSAAASFKAFSGKGKSLGGTPVEAPRFNSQGASASRGRSTPATRAASSATESSIDSAAAAQPSVSSAPGARAGAALIAKLEEKKKQEAESTYAVTTTDVGHDMAPGSEDDMIPAEDKDSAAYGKLNETENSV